MSILRCVNPYYPISARFRRLVGRFVGSGKKAVLQKKEKILETIAVSRIFLELLGRFELPTSSLPMTRSTD